MEDSSQYIILSPEKFILIMNQINKENNYQNDTIIDVLKKLEDLKGDINASIEYIKTIIQLKISYTEYCPISKVDVPHTSTLLECYDFYSDFY